MRRLEKTQFPDNNEIRESIGEYIELKETMRTRHAIQQILEI